MNVLTVAKKDFRDAVRSRTLLGLTAVFIIFTGGLVYIYSNAPSLVGGGPVPDVDSFANLGVALTGSVHLVIPLLGLIVSYKSIVGERASGSIKFLLAFPNTRADVVLGKLIGRTAVVAVATITGLIVVAVIAILEYNSFRPVDYLLFILTTTLLAFVFVSIAVGLSAGIKSTSHALYAVVGLFVLLFIWNFLPGLIRYVLNGFSAPKTAKTPDWVQFFELINPQTAYQYIVTALIPDLTFLAPVADSAPFYLQHWFGFVVLIFWVVLPLSVGYIRFRATDL